MDLLYYNLLLVHHWNTFAAHKLNYDFGSKFIHATHNGRLEYSKLWFIFCKLYLHQSLTPKFDTKHYSYLYQKFIHKNSGFHKSFLQSLHLLFFKLNSKRSLLHKNQYEIHDYSNEINFKAGHPCRRINISIICVVSFGQFSTSEFLFKQSNYLKHNLQLLIMEQFHFHIFISHFHFLKPADNHKESDALRIGPVVDTHKLPSYLLQGHVASCEIIFTNHIMIFNVFIRDVTLSQFKIYIQVIDIQLYDRHVACFFLAKNRNKIRCSHFSDLPLESLKVTDRIKRSNITMFILRIFVYKYQNVLLYDKYSLMNMNIYDGPTINSKKVDGETTLMSSFQATISVSKDIILAFKRGKLKYIGKAVNVRDYIWNESDFNLLLNISGNIFKQSKVVHQKIKFKTTGKYFKIVLEALSYFGPNEYPERCFYGGIAIYLIEATRHIESLTACWNISSKDGKILNGSSPIYNIVTTAHTASVYIVLYGYEDYSLVHSTINISETNCMGIYLKLFPCHGHMSFLIYLYFIANLSVTAENHPSLYNIKCGFKTEFSKITIPMEACLTFLISQKVYMSNPKSLEVRISYIFKDTSPDGNEYLKVWNVETYGSNYIIHSTGYVNYINDLFLYESILQANDAYFSYDKVVTEFCSSSKLVKCKSKVKDSYLSKDRNDFGDPIHSNTKSSNLRKDRKNFRDPIYSNLTRVSKIKYLYYPSPLQTAQMDETLYLYHQKTFSHQYWTFMKVYFIFCKLPIWKSYVSHRSLLRDILLYNCQKKSFHLREEVLSKYGYTLYTKKNRQYKEKSAFMITDQYSYYKYLDESISNNFGYYSSINFYSKLSILPDVVCELVVLYLTNLKGFQGKKIMYSANVSKSENLHIYIPSAQSIVTSSGTKLNGSTCSQK